MSDMDSIGISNKEALRDKIHEIHNYLRNNGAGYGMNALKVFNVLYGLKKIEENNLLDKVKLKRPECEFSYLLQMAKADKDKELCDLIFNEITESIFNSNIKEILFYIIPQNIKPSVFSHLIKEIDSITSIEKTCNVLLSGEIYEYFIGRDQTAISELGAYFTDRHIVDYIFNKLDPELENDEVSTMIDMFGGSGGFTTGYVNYLNKKYDNINWKTEIDKIYHYDMNEDVIKSAALELFCLTGILPNMKNLEFRNSFTHDFNKQKFKYPITNPPYGGDKNEKSQAQKKRDILKDFLTNKLKEADDKEKINKQLKHIEALNKQEKEAKEKNKVSIQNSSQRIQKFAKDNKLTGNDKESASLILLMDILEVGGTAIGVLKEGVFFDKKYKDIRECLIKNYNVREVISVPQDQFENTSTKTSIIIFDNTEEKTSEIKFYNLNVEKYEKNVIELINDEYQLIEYKDDIRELTDTLISKANLEELKNKNWSLNGKDYNLPEIKVSKDYELIKLGEICEFNPSSIKKNIKTFKLVKIKDIDNGTIINFDEIDALEVKNTNICKYNDIIISNVRPKSKKSVFLTESLLKDIDEVCFTMPIIRVKNFNPMYIYSILYPFIDTFETELCTGSTYPTFKIDKLLDYKIPIPKNKEKMNVWGKKILKPYNEKNIKELKIKELENTIQEQIKHIIKNEDCEEVELGSICEVQDGCKFKDSDLNNNVDDIPLIRATYINSKIITSYIKEDIKFNKYIVNFGDIIFSQVGDVGSICKYQEKKIGYNKMNAFRLRGINFNQNYLYYLLKSDEFKNKVFSNGTIVKFIKIPDLREIKIKIPKNKKLITNMESLFSQIEKLNEEVIQADKLYKQYIQELSDEAIIKDNIIDNKEEIQEIKPINEVKIKKKVTKVVKTKSIEI